MPNGPVKADQASNKEISPYFRPHLFRHTPSTILSMPYLKGSLQIITWLFQNLIQQEQRGHTAKSLHCTKSHELGN